MSIFNTVSSPRARRPAARKPLMLLAIALQSACTIEINGPLIGSDTLDTLPWDESGLPDFTTHDPDAVPTTSGDPGDPGASDPDTTAAPDTTGEPADPGTSTGEAASTSGADTPDEDASTSGTSTTGEDDASTSSTSTGEDDASTSGAGTGADETTTGGSSSGTDGEASETGVDSGATAAVCGNGLVEDGEECDGSAPSTTTCETLGFAGGTVLCDPLRCKLNVQTCVGCGNGSP